MRPPRKLKGKNAELWMRSYQHLLRYVEREDTAKVPARHVEEDGFRLGQWVGLQRTKKRRGRLHDDQRQLLEKLPGWSWGAAGRSGQMPDEEPPPVRGGPEWDFISCGPNFRRDIVWTALLGWGMLRRVDAVRVGIESVLQGELRTERHLRPEGRMVWLVERAIDAGLRERKYDRRRGGYIRAVLRDVKWYCNADWQDCVLGSRSSEPVTKEDAAIRALDWARINMGLETVEDTNLLPPDLLTALDRLIEAGEIEVLR